MTKFEYESNQGCRVLTIYNTENVLVDLYEIKMFMNNRPDNFLDVSMVVIDNIRSYRYNIQDCISVREMYEKKNITKSDLERFVGTLKDVVKSLKECLIDVDRVYLSLDTVFVRDGKFYFCFYGDGEITFDQGIRGLLEFFLERVDYKDKDAVVYVYEIYHKIVRDGNSIESVEIRQSRTQTSNPSKRKNPTENIIKEEIVSSVKPALDIQETPSKKKESYIYVVAIFIVMGVLVALAYYRVIDVSYKIVVGVGLIIAAGILYMLQGNKKNMEVSPAPKVVEEECTTLLSPEDITPWLIVEQQGEEERVLVNKSPFLIGSQKERVNLHIASKSVSRIHGRIFNEGSNYYIEDMESTNGTYVNDRKLRANEILELYNEDIITLADVDMVFRK